MWSPVVVWVATSTQPRKYIGAHEVLCHRPSIEASLSGWLLVTSMAMLGPKMNRFAKAKKMNNGSASLRLDLARSTLRFLSTYQALTLTISAEPAVPAAAKTCIRRGMNEGVLTTVQKSVMTARAGAGVSAMV